MLVINRKYWLVAMLVVIQTLAGIIGGLVFASTPRENIIFPGVFIRGIEVGGLSEEQARRVLKQRLAPELKKETIVFRYNNKKWEFTYDQLGISFNIPATIKKALMTGRGEGRLDSLAMFRARYRKPELSLEYEVNKAKLDQAMSEMAAEIEEPVKDADITVSGGKVLVMPEVNGKKFDFEANAEKLYERLSEVRPGPVSLVVSEIKPRVTALDLKGIKEQLGVGVTTFPGSDKDKGKVISAAVKNIHGKMIRPGEVFSFNGALGESVQEEEYLRASLVGTNRLSKGSSGGVTRVATTLYQAVLYSGLRVVERHAHLVPPGYAKLGQDAAVAKGLLDLKFENDTDNPIYLSAVVKGSRIVINLLGVKKNGLTVQITTRETLTKQPELTGPRGSHARVYRIYYNNGIEVNREIISDDDYI